MVVLLCWGQCLPLRRNKMCRSLGFAETAPVALDGYRAEYPGTPLHSGLRSRIGAGEKPKAVATLAFFAIHKNVYHDIPRLSNLTGRDAWGRGSPYFWGPPACQPPPPKTCSNRHVITSGLGAAEVLRRFGGLKGWIITENRWYGDTRVSWSIHQVLPIGPWYIQVSYLNIHIVTIVTIVDYLIILDCSLISLFWRVFQSGHHASPLFDPFSGYHSCRAADLWQECCRYLWWCSAPGGGKQVELSRRFRGSWRHFQVPNMVVLMYGIVPICALFISLLLR